MLSGNSTSFSPIPRLPSFLYLLMNSSRLDYDPIKTFPKVNGFSVLSKESLLTSIS